MIGPDSIIAEIVVTSEISSLANGGENMTQNFAELLQTWIVQG